VHRDGGGGIGIGRVRRDGGDGKLQQRRRRCGDDRHNILQSGDEKEKKKNRI